MTTEIRIANLRNHPKNIRKSYGDLKELTASIKENGVLQNLVVVPDPKHKDSYLVVAGNCRLRAAKKAGLESVPCTVTELDEQAQVLLMLTENMQRKNLTVLEEAQAVQMCLEDFGMKIADVAQATGLSVSTIRSKAVADVVKEKTEHPTFNLTITDYNNMSKIKDEEVATEILQSASSSSNLAWRVDQAIENMAKDRNFDILSARAEAEGIAFTDEVSSSEIYSGKWETLATIDLAKDVPDDLLKEDPDSPYYDHSELFYVRHYGTVRIIRRKKTEKRVLSEQELHERDIRKRAKQIKELYGFMLDEIGSFVRSMMDGTVPVTEECDASIPALWDILRHHSATVSRYTMGSVLGATEVYSLPNEEKAALLGRVDALPVFSQMLAVAYQSLRSLRIMADSGKYSETVGNDLMALYDVINPSGFSFSSEEYDAVLLGTHDLYLPEDYDTIEASTEPADASYNADVSESDTQDISSEDAAEEGFQDISDGDHNADDSENEDIASEGIAEDDDLSGWEYTDEDVFSDTTVDGTEDPFAAPADAPTEEYAEAA